MTTTATHCPYCALQCGMRLETRADRRPDETPVTVAARDFPTNLGTMCQKGFTSAELLDSPERLRTPLVRDEAGGALREASWDEALDRVVAGVRRTQAAHGRDAVAVFGGGGLTNEKCYTLGKLARLALGTRNIDYNGRFCMASAAGAGIRAFGVDRGLPFPLQDLAEADVVVLVGANVAETMPPFVQHLDAMRARGGAVVVVDPRRTATANGAALHLAPAPGTDLALVLGLLHLVVAGGHVDEAYVEERTTGFDAVRHAVAEWWPERVERVTGVPVAQLKATVALLAGAQRAVLLTGRGAEQHAKGTDTVSAVIDLALALGLPGRRGSGYGCVTGQGNGQGGREHGQKADQLPGYRRIDDPAARQHVADVWGVDPDALPGPGRSAYELLDTLGTDEGARALLVFGSNLVVSAPRAVHVEQRLRALDLLVVADVVLSETAALADVVLPVAQWAEEEGTMTNLEGRVIRRRQALPRPDGVRTDLEVCAELAARLEAPGRWPVEPQAVWDELRAASAGGPADYAGITYERLDGPDATGVFWPCPSEDSPGTPRMFLDRFATPDGRARFVPVRHRPPDEQRDADFPVWFTTGRVLQHYQSGAQTRRVPQLAEAVPGPRVELHPDLAASLEVRDGDRLRVTSRRGSVEGSARVTDAIRPDTVFVPFHWGGAGRANSLTNPALDPTSRMPEFKVCAARVDRVEEVHAR